jgi:hypothetical protein
LPLPYGVSTVTLKKTMAMRRDKPVAPPLISDTSAARAISAAMCGAIQFARMRDPMFYRLHKIPETRIRSDDINTP